MSDAKPVLVPDLGNFKDVAVIELLVASGDTVAVDTPLLTLETEKATMDVPSPVAGVVGAWQVKKGDAVNAGDLLLHIAPSSAAVAAVASGPAPGPDKPAPVAARPANAPAADPGETVVTRIVVPTADLPGARSDLPLIDEPGFSRAHAGPSVRHLARELGVDLARIAGSGFKGRITHDDVKAYVKRVLRGLPAGGTPGAAPGAALPAVPRVDFAAFGAVELKPLSRVQKLSGPRLHASWVNIPHVTQFDEADITALEATRSQLKRQAGEQGVKLTPLAFIVRACVKVLRDFPVVNASLDESGQNLVFKKYCHIGFAADTPNGLLVPVIRDADRKDIFAIARDLAQLSEKARAGKLPATDMQGGSFTISSLGGIGGTAFTPIINAPEVAILGVSRSANKLVWRDDSFVPRLMLPLSLSYDHRVIDGAMAVRFTTALAAALADPATLIDQAH
jgi:pyruvate dehydrogenase E2 component (dihydrolipoamide acetyltransferase)